MKIQKSISLVKKFSAYLVSAILLQASLATLAQADLELWKKQNALLLDPVHPSFLFTARLMLTPGGRINRPGEYSPTSFITENRIFQPVAPDYVSQGFDIDLAGLRGAFPQYPKGEPPRVISVPVIVAVAQSQGLRAKIEDRAQLESEGFQLAAPIEEFHLLQNRYEEILGKTKRIYLKKVGDLMLFGHSAEAIQAELKKRGFPAGSSPGYMLAPEITPESNNQGVEVRGYICDESVNNPALIGQKPQARLHSVYRVSATRPVPQGCEEYVRFSAWHRNSPLVYLASAEKKFRSPWEADDEFAVRQGYDRVRIVRVPFYSTKSPMLLASNSGRIIEVKRESTAMLGMYGGSTNLLVDNSGPSSRMYSVMAGDYELRARMIRDGGLGYEIHLSGARYGYHPAVLLLAEEILGIQGFPYTTKLSINGEILMNPNKLRGRLLIDSYRYMLGQVSLAELRAAYEALR